MLRHVCVTWGKYTILNMKYHEMNRYKTIIKEYVICFNKGYDITWFGTGTNYSLMGLI